jgi:hypothetical protein
MTQDTTTRPIGVALIALPYFLQAAATVLLAGLITLGLGARLMCGLYGIPPQLSMHNSSLVIVAMLLGALFSAMMGYGIWNFRPWARRVCLYTTGLTLLKLCRVLFAEAGTLDSWSASYRLFGVAIGAVTIWYLLQPEVKARFQPANRTRPGPYRPATVAGPISPLARIDAYRHQPAAGRIASYRATNL